MQALAQESQQPLLPDILDSGILSQQALSDPGVACCPAECPSVDTLPGRSAVQTPGTPQQRQFNSCSDRNGMSRPTTRSHQSLFATILGKPVHVHTRPRSQLIDFQQHRRMEQEAPRQHMGRKTQSKAKRNSRYANALRALERAQDQEDMDMFGSMLTESCATMFHAAGGSHTGSESERGHSSKLGERVRTEDWQTPPGAISDCDKRVGGSAFAIGTGSGDGRTETAGACNAVLPGAVVPQHKEFCRSAGIVGDVLANLRGD